MPVERHLPALLERPGAEVVDETASIVPEPYGRDGGAIAASSTRSSLSLAVALLGFFVITLDAVVVNVALPSIRGDLGGGMTGLQLRKRVRRVATARSPTSRLPSAS